MRTLTIQLTEEELRLFQRTCFLRILNTAHEVIQEYIPTNEEISGEEPYAVPDEGWREKADNCQIEIEDIRHHIENVRSKIVEASRHTKVEPVLKPNADMAD